jgi:glucosyl-3-phosphoglycerate synthase
MLASFDHSEFELQDLIAAKRETVSVCVPTRETVETIEATVREVVGLRDAGLLDRVIVIDADSADGTGTIAAAAGAEVFSESELVVEAGPVEGKGDAMWRALSVAGGEIVVYLDGDVRDFGAHYVVGLLGPLLGSEGVDFVKGFYRRPLALDGIEIEDGGGRVTELTAKPLLELIAPELTAFHQPLAGECAARRSLLEEIPFSTGYGVEIAMLVEVWRRAGIARMAQVGLGSKRNSHQALSDLAKMSREVTEALATQTSLSPPGLGAGESPAAGQPGGESLGSILPAPAWTPRLHTRPPMREQLASEAGAAQARGAGAGAKAGNEAGAAPEAVSEAIPSSG